MIFFIFSVLNHTSGVNLNCSIYFQRNKTSHNWGFHNFSYRRRYYFAKLKMSIFELKNLLLVKKLKIKSSHKLVSSSLFTVHSLHFNVITLHRNNVAYSDCKIWSGTIKSWRRSCGEHEQASFFIILKNSRFCTTRHIFFRKITSSKEFLLLLWLCKIQSQKKKLFQHIARAISCILIRCHQKRKKEKQ